MLKKKLEFVIQISKPAFVLHQRLLRVMAGLLFLAVSKLNLVFIILKEDSKKKKKKKSTSVLFNFRKGKGSHPITE